MSLVLALVSFASADDTLAQRNGKAAYQAALDQEVAEVNAACGSRLAATYDWTTYPSFDPIADRTQSACQQAIGTLAALCATDAGKQAVSAIPRAIEQRRPRWRRWRCAVRRWRRPPAAICVRAAI